MTPITQNRQENAMNEQTPIALTEGGSLSYGLPAWTYFNQELTQLEYERVILPSWQFVCHVNQLKQPGDFATLDMMRDSVVVMRGKDGELRAFSNVCRHRGAKLLDGEGSCKGRVKCPYHGWSYALDGRLVGVPSEQTFPGMKKADFGLKPVEMEIILGLVFVRLIPGGPSLALMFKDFIELVRPYRIEEMEPVNQLWTGSWNCNWKVAVDNNLENYHVPVGHPGYHRMLDNDLMGEINEHGVAVSESVLRDRLSPVWSERLYQQLAPEVLTDLPEKNRRTWLFFSMAPNIGIDIYPDSMDIFQILPKSAETCLMRFPVFSRPDARREAKLLRYLNARINRQVGHEDRDLSERVQMGLRSNGYEPGPLSDYEHAIRDFHDRLRAACPVVTLPEAPSPGSLAARNTAMLTEQAAA
ncbi:MAG TPA: aromatic ring-hydroxylating dioxygenase subunit alpha [Hypericibacter adhaerens]|jgi:phenylpropionate dioxygenase-like ring-hydroxylating dioxygenase large terminal subunit|uniref:(2Fe-2S) ferredoxin n=2 Tax=Hypericibacter adhaerens TaxID=2602016 RepID=A0A5J6MTT5_9PROT|nr:aromatic ring-hydroxylating dioxygenase subunit alpha [Hypericibacter adhaerens]QEX20145.1 (2Fe-2S) ferredoxin [Hypericibacter adhaerens]HWA46505.1 aromatic ring-hydroxylating dioxygenase subunit alpha [Hypericibacter adhaerens]